VRPVIKAASLAVNPSVRYVAMTRCTVGVELKLFKSKKTTIMKFKNFP
jgi:hypothetical protein